MKLNKKNPLREKFNIIFHYKNNFLLIEYKPIFFEEFFSGYPLRDNNDIAHNK